MTEAQADMRRNLLASEQTEKARQSLLQHLKPHVRRGYRTGDGGLVLDRGENIEAAQTTAGAALVALEIASERFRYKRLQINGTENFRQ